MTRSKGPQVWFEPAPLQDSANMGRTLLLSELEAIPLPTFLRLTYPHRAQVRLHQHHPSCFKYVHFNWCAGWNCISFNTIIYANVVKNIFWLVTFATLTISSLVLGIYFYFSARLLISFHAILIAVLVLMCYNWHRLVGNWGVLQLIGYSDNTFSLLKFSFTHNL